MNTLTAIALLCHQVAKWRSSQSRNKNGFVFCNRRRTEGRMEDIMRVSHCVKMVTFSSTVRTIQHDASMAYWNDIAVFRPSTICSVPTSRPFVRLSGNHLCSSVVLVAAALYMRPCAEFGPARLSWRTPGEGRGASCCCCLAADIAIEMRRRRRRRREVIWSLGWRA